MPDTAHGDHEHSPLHHPGDPRRWLLMLLAAWLLMGVYIVRPEEQGVVRLLGRVVQDRLQPGLHWRAPWPITRLSKVRVNEARRVTIGFDLAAEATGTKPAPRQGQFVTGDENILNIQVVVQYCVDEPVRFLFAAQQVDGLVAKVTEAALTRQVQRETVDCVLTEGRARLQDDVRRQAAATLSAYEVGVRLVSLSIKSAYPPQEVSDAFKAVASARGDRDRIIDEARGYLNETVEKANGEAEATLRNAEAEGSRVVAQAEGDAERFTDVYGEYAKAKKVTRTRLYVEAMEQIIPRMETIVSDSDSGTRPMDFGIITSAPTPTSGGPAQ